MSNDRSRKGCIAWFVGGIVILELIILIVPACRFAEFWLLSNATNGLFDQYFPTALGPLITGREALLLSSYENTLYAGIQQAFPDDHTYLINSNTGALVATVDQRSVINADRQFYLTGLQDTPQTFSITATRLSDNQTAWHHTFNPSPLSFTTHMQNGICYFASVQEGGTGPSVLYAFSENSGALLWRHTVSRSNGFFYTVNNGFVYILGQEGIEALVAGSGNTHWFHPVDFAGMYSIVADTSTVYTLGENIQALHASDGQQSWALSPGYSLYSPLYNYLGLQQGVLYVGIDGQFRASDGSQAWHYQSQNTAPSSLSSQLLGVLNGTIYVQLHNDHVALQSTNGQKIWNLILTASTNMKAILSGQTIYYGYALHTSNIPPPPHWVLSISQAYYYCSNAINLFAIKSQNGALQWHKQYKVTCAR